MFREPGSYLGPSLLVLLLSLRWGDYPRLSKQWCAKGLGGKGVGMGAQRCHSALHALTWLHL